MSTRHLLDPELMALADAADDAPLTHNNLHRVREAREATLVMGDTERAGVNREEIIIPGGTEPDVRCLMYTPNDEAESRPGYLHVHGGGYILGEPEMSDIMNILVAKRIGAVVVSVDYRLAPEHPIPAPIDDCYLALAYLHNNADQWRVDRSRIGIGGESAGGGLAAALAIHARDIGEYDICHQHLTYPMLDNLTGTSAQPGDPLTGEFVWTRERNQFGWQCYLGDADPVAPQVPARVESYEGLPPTWMFTASLDLFRDENIAYAQSLLAAGVSTDLVVMAGACHGFQGIPGTRLGKQYLHAHIEALRHGLNAA